jgi:hypothetical protein
MPREVCLPWQLIDDAPSAPGLYSWYYRLSLPRHDVEQLIREVKSGSRERAKELVAAFFRTFVFRPLEEEPYDAVIEGKLKPKYSGKLSYVANVSGDLIDRVVEDVERIRAIADVLDASVPHFASPIYIGMSSNLRNRLSRHKALIERFVAARRVSADYVGDGDEEADLSFAKDVARRGLVPGRLVVFVAPTQAGGDEYKDVENLLNRINFPLCGRN